MPQKAHRSCRSISSDENLNDSTVCATRNRTVTNFSDILRVNEKMFPLYRAGDRSQSSSIRVMLRVVSTPGSTHTEDFLSIDENRRLITVTEPQNLNNGIRSVTSHDRRYTECSNSNNNNKENRNVVLDNVKHNLEHEHDRTLHYDDSNVNNIMNNNMGNNRMSVYNDQHIIRNSNGNISEGNVERNCDNVRDSGCNTTKQSVSSILKSSRCSVNKVFSFDEIFQPSQSLSSICSVSLSDVMDTLMAGADACLFTFGHSKLGKTYTMLGEDQSYESVGVIPYAVGSLFRLITEQKTRTGARFSVRISAIEITGSQENVKDLLKESQDGTEVILREDDVRGPQIDNITEQRVTSAECAAKLVDAAITNRTIADSGEESKNSHMMFTINLYQYRVNRETNNYDNHQEVVGGRSRLHLIDFGSCGRIKHGTALSLSALGTVITALLSGQRHVPFRDSKLSLLLRYALSGSTCSVTMLAHISTNPNLYTDTLHVIQTAARICRLKSSRKHRGFGSSRLTSSSHSTSLDGRSCSSLSASENGGLVRRSRRRPGVRMGTGGQWRNSGRFYPSDPECSSVSSAPTVIHLGVGGSRWGSSCSASEGEGRGGSYRERLIGNSRGYKRSPQPSVSSLSSTSSHRRHGFSRRHAWESPIKEIPDLEDVETTTKKPARELWVDGPKIDKINKKWPAGVELWVDGPGEFCVMSESSQKNPTNDLNTLRSSKCTKYVNAGVVEEKVAVVKKLITNNCSNDDQVNLLDNNQGQMQEQSCDSEIQDRISTDIDNCSKNRSMNSSFEQRLDDTLERSSSASMQDLVFISDDEGEGLVSKQNNKAIQHRLDRSSSVDCSYYKHTYTGSISGEGERLSSGQGCRLNSGVWGGLNSSEGRRLSSCNENYEPGEDFVFESERPGKISSQFLRHSASGSVRVASSAPASPMIGGRSGLMLGLWEGECSKQPHQLRYGLNLHQNTVQNNENRTVINKQEIGYKSQHGNSKFTEYSDKFVNCKTDILSLTAASDVRTIESSNNLKKFFHKDRKYHRETKSCEKELRSGRKEAGKYNSAELDAKNSRRVRTSLGECNRTSLNQSADPVRTSLASRLTALLSPYHKVTQPKPVIISSEVGSSASNPVLSGSKSLSERDGSSGYESMILDFESDTEQRSSSREFFQRNSAKRYKSKVRSVSRRSQSTVTSSNSSPLISTPSDYEHETPPLTAPNTPDNCLSPLSCVNCTPSSNCPSHNFCASHSNGSQMISAHNDTSNRSTSNNNFKVLHKCKRSNLSDKTNTSSNTSSLEPNCNLPSNCSVTSTNCSSVNCSTSHISSCTNSQYSTCLHSAPDIWISSAENPSTLLCDRTTTATTTTTRFHKSSSSSSSMADLSVDELCYTREALQAELFTALGILMLQPNKDSQKATKKQKTKNENKISKDSLLQEISALKKQLHLYKSRIMLVTSFDSSVTS